MSADEVSALREDIATLRAIVEERARSASGNAAMLKTIGAAVLIQIVMSVYIAGQKTQMLDRLQQDVVAIQKRLDK
jgi:cell division protein FtsB